MLGRCDPGGARSFLHQFRPFDCWQDCRPGGRDYFGHVTGELRASIVVIAEGAQMEGGLVAGELTIGGHVKGTIHANRVKLNGTAVVEGDIFHRSLVIDENARFEGMSRRHENPIDIP